MKSLIALLLIFFLNLFVNPAHSQWILQNSGTDKNLYGITCSHSTINIAWACGEDGIILHTSNGGQTWIQQNSGTTVDLYSIAFQELSGSPVIAVGQSGTILRTLNQGLTWEQVPSGTTKHLRHTSDFGMMACGDSGVILKGTNGGASWTIMNNANTADLYSICGGFSPHIAVGKNGTVLRYNPIPGTWDAANSGTTTDLLTVPMFDGHRILGGKNGLIMKSSNGGSTWNSVSIDYTTDINYIEEASINFSVLYAAGDSGVILKTTNSGLTWGRQTSNVTENLNSSFSYLTPTESFMCGDNGVILKTTNGGGPMTGIINEPSSVIPGSFELYQNYPNPFNPETTIKFNIPQPGFVTLKVYDLNGKEVAVIVNTILPAAAYEYLFNAESVSGGLSSGIYLYKLEAGKFKAARKLILLK